MRRVRNLADTKSAVSNDALLLLGSLGGGNAGTSTLAGGYLLSALDKAGDDSERVSHILAGMGNLVAGDGAATSKYVVKALQRFSNCADADVRAAAENGLSNLAGTLSDLEESEAIGDSEGGPEASVEIPGYKNKFGLIEQENVKSWVDVSSSVTVAPEKCSVSASGDGKHICCFVE